MAHRPLGPVFPASGHAWSGGRLSLAWPGLAVWLRAHLLEERERWLSWLPVAVGTGVALYFALPAEPPVWLGATGLLVAAVVLSWSWWRLPREALHGYAPGLLGPLALLLGFTVATVRTELVEAPVLERRGAYQLEATVLLIEDRVRGQRLLLGEPTLEGLEPGATPLRVRVSTRSTEPPLQPGDRVRLRAVLMPPSPPVEPHGFDFARQAYFERLGAVGFALTGPELLSRADARGWWLGLAALRQRLAHEISVAIPGTAGRSRWRS